jgi:hypothetical protein
MGVVTKHAFAPSLEKTQLMISQWSLGEIGIMQEEANVALWEITSFEKRNTVLDSDCWRDTAHPRVFDIAG